jgi:hypothetical protein
MENEVKIQEVKPSHTNRGIFLVELQWLVQDYY